MNLISFGTDKKMQYHRKVTGAGRWLKWKATCCAGVRTWEQMPRTHIKSWAWSHALSYPSTVSGRGGDRRVGVRDSVSGE